MSTAQQSRWHSVREQILGYGSGFHRLSIARAAPIGIYQKD